MKKLNLQLFANLDEILENHKDAFENSEEIKNNFTAITSKLQELGYDVLINHKEKAEFVPILRLNEVIAQRDNFKQQVEALNAQLKELQNQASNNKELNEKIQQLVDQNNKLLADIEKSKITLEIITAAKDAHNPKAILPFINMDKIKINSKGEVVGVEEEINRIRQEMPFLFINNGADNKQRKAGIDPGTNKDTKRIVDMNTMIRMAAGRRHF